MKIAAGTFKSTCLRLMDRVNETREEVIITKRGTPVAKLVAVDDGPAPSAFGALKNTVTINGDITAPTGEVWHAEQ